MSTASSVGAARSSEETRRRKPAAIPVELALRCWMIYSGPRLVKTRHLTNPHRKNCRPAMGVGEKSSLHQRLSCSRKITLGCTLSELRFRQPPET